MIKSWKAQGFKSWTKDVDIKIRNEIVVQVELASFELNNNCCLLCSWKHKRFYSYFKQMFNSNWVATGQKKSHHQCCQRCQSSRQPIMFLSSQFCVVEQSKYLPEVSFPQFPIASVFSVLQFFPQHIFQHRQSVAKNLLDCLSSINIWCNIQKKYIKLRIN